MTEQYKNEFIDVFDKWKKISSGVNYRKDIFPNGFTFLSTGRVIISYSNTKEYKTFDSVIDALLIINKELNDYSKQH